MWAISSAPTTVIGEDKETCLSPPATWNGRKTWLCRILVSNEMVADLYVFGPFMQNRISANMQGRLVIRIDLYWSKIVDSKLNKESS